MAKLRNLISKEMVEQNRLLHEGPDGFGGSGWKHNEAILAFKHELRAGSVLDYGCGECTLRKIFGKRGIQINLTEYDPAIPSRSRLPKPHDLVVCTDVLEHVEPDKVDNVLKHLCELSIKGCYLVIATRLANKILPDGRNAHLVVEDTPWWRERVARLSWAIVREEDKRRGNGTGHEVRFWLKQ